ncbi:fumarate reductase subunit C [[Haemophilus] ducreyi]|uniref:Fumarate reductase subunit C n=2 Tax=Haemophilus ducreyi TaxID=730 RepID=FRDC_HAEDU|nr:fumarate reductase subunit FrdC [[Haemophilus] ducreyi]P59841.1 RecName: Full=Fumarate reductase subunit C; AltName: Full=Quinol-fumarate reductase subunit C; Short=QFR subunit C [[Haemophilus] ducreyi 35000HP]AAP95048.1 fumarate reductase, 15 kD hydrophobic protein [[Haemophilus] ducreyi 35000HP]AKO30237.1 fumarate reductase [[Haemophilus] ducreyi]AKO31670.1 fumarate reductase [[Haemophilus] ducreyi]AKO33121.1 fumarate reductase [[Haemophilus] ducreyi]AKO34571.1 fumarate reductase [[Haemo
MTTKRKAYVREMKANWWTKLDFYRMYMIREATCIATIWFCLVLLYGVISLGGRHIENFISFSQNPLVVILNIISLAGLLYHAATLYVMTPQVLTIVVKNERLNPNILKNALWAITGLVSLLALVLVYI